MNAKATPTDEDIIRLEREIDSLSRRIENFNQQSTENIKESLLSDMQLYGRFHIEFLTTNNRGNAYLNLGGDNGKDKFDNVRITNSRFGLKRKLSNKNDFVFVVKVVDGSLKIKEMYITYKMLPKLAFNFGHMDTVLTMEAEDFNNYVPFSSVSRYYTTGNLFNYTKGPGIRVSYLDDNYGIYSGVFGNSYNDDLKDINKVTFNFRTFYNPYKRSDNVVHIAASYVGNYMDYNRTTRVPTDDKNLLYDLKKFESVGGEFALNFGWFNFQSEYMRGFATPASTNYKKTSDLSSYYTQLTFMLTGETTKYRNGCFTGINVASPVNEGGLGAFEFALRFAKTDLEDKRSNIVFDYGKYDEYSVAFSWYPTNFFKTTIHYSWIEEEFKDSFALLANGNKKNNKYGVLSFKNKVFFF